MEFVLKENSSSTSVKPIVSIVMPCFNEIDNLKRSIGSVQEQDFTNWELIVVDDGSTDGSYEMIEKISMQDFRVKACKNKYGKGVASALNCGIDNSIGKYIARWDADDESYPERLSSSVAYLNLHKDVGLVGCGVEKRHYSEGKVQAIEIFTYFDSHKLLVQSLARFVVIGANCMFRRSVYKKAGRFDPNIGGEEELEFLIRVAEVTKIGYITDILYIYNVIEGKARSFKNKMKKKIIMAKLNILAIKKFNLGKGNYLYPLAWLIYGYMPKFIKNQVRKKYTKW
jgi:glycosyltransferase EpsE